MKKGLHAALLDAAAGISQKRQDAGEQEHRAQSNPEEVASTAILYYIEEILSVSLPLQAREPHHGVEEREKREQIQEIKLLQAATAVTSTSRTPFLRRNTCSTPQSISGNTTWN